MACQWMRELSGGRALWRAGIRFGGRLAVGPEEGDLGAEAGQGLLVVPGQMLAASAHPCAASPRSARRNCAEPPAPRIAPAAASRRAWLCPTMRISAPSLASSMAAKRPIPRETPV